MFPLKAQNRFVNNQNTLCTGEKEKSNSNVYVMVRDRVQLTRERLGFTSCTGSLVTDYTQTI